MECKIGTFISTLTAVGAFGRLRIGLLITIIVAACSLPRVAAQVVLAPAVTYGVGHNPLSLAITDINSDGKLDLICGNAGDNPYNNGSLSILTNNGSGGFALASTVEIGHGPGGIAIADVNGDGWLDLVSANWDNGNGNTLSAWTNDGNGVLVSNATYVVGIGPSSIAAVDVNGDRRVDLICNNYGNGSGNTLTLLTNNGSGLFGSNATLNVGSGPRFVVAADVNEDGHPDLICVNYGGSLGTGNTMTVLTNDGKGGFGWNAALNVGHGPSSVTAADVNGDGHLDLICANSGDNTLTVLTNNGGGIFSSNSYTVGKQPEWVAAADVNGDGKPDLVSANFFGDSSYHGNLSVLTNNGTGGFVLAATLQTGSSLPNIVLPVDVNGDGKLDLACVNAGGNTVAVLTNNTIFPAPRSIPPLIINSQGNKAVVSWPSISPGWSLQQNADLRAAHWGPSGYSGFDIIDDGTNKSLVITHAMGNLYFRLLHP